VDSALSQSEIEKDWALLPLTPEFIDTEHGGYVKALEKALSDRSIKNIALSGRYGVGKSSILQELARSRKDNVVELSLSTLAPMADDAFDDAVPKQAKTTTNRIQQEIVKQLLYREKPSKTPGSRFRRIERFSFLREMAYAGLAGTVIAVIALLTGWTSQIEAELLPKTDLGQWSHGIVLVLGALATGIVRWVFYGRVHIRQFSAGAATVTLDDHSVSYFDQYLDEIVYFFEVSKRSIVIFEDIDRFNDSRIFETLLALNTLLNAQRPDHDPIRFIYAIKDSIFDQSKLSADKRRKVEADIKDIKDPAQAEAVRANRTKFFDLVIPVVPFITHRSAKNLAWQILEEVDSEIDAALTDLTARYIPDMRLIKNLHNEFIVFRDRIFSGAGGDLELCKTELFAMMLYKCTHLADFEVISIGKSDIDKLYQAERDLVSVNINRLHKEIRQTRNKLTNIERITTESESLGNKLVKHIERTIRSSKNILNVAPNSGLTAGTCWLNRQQLGKEDLRTSQFWEEFTGATDDPVLIWKLNNNQRLSLEFTRSTLSEVLGNSLDPDSWNERAEDRLTAEIEQNKEDLKFLRQAQMGDLIKRREFTAPYGGETQSFDAVAQKVLDGESLAYQLIRHGYINRNFTLYTATYHGNRVSAAAQNFIMLHVERDLMDEHFELNGPDVEAVVRECGEQSLAEPALYNIAILDHLLNKGDSTADTMIRSLVQLGERQQRFIQVYLNSATEQAAFIGRFTLVAPNVLTNLVENIELAEVDRFQFVSCALGNLGRDVRYRTSKAVGAYLSDHYTDFPILTSESLDSDNAERIANVFVTAKVQVSALPPLTSSIQRAFVTHDCYVLNRENLSIALGNDTELTLDRAQRESSRVYQRLLQDLPTYLSAIEGYSTTVGSPSYFISVIEDVLQTDAGQLSEVIAHASNDCVVEDITEVSQDAWPHLAEHRRFPATFANVKEYIEGVGEVDAYLSGLVGAADGIINHEPINEEDKQALAVNLLATHDSLLSASSRARLVASLQLDSVLSVDMIHTESGELFALLLKVGVIADSAESYAHLSETDWSTREQFIEQSKRFPEFMTPDLVGSDLANLLSSGRVAMAIKEVIVGAASEYAEKCDRSGLAELAKFAVRDNHTLAPELVEEMAENEISTSYIIQLLHPNLDAVPYEQLARILNALGDNYSALTFPGRDQPKFPNTDEHRALLDRLTEYGRVVSKIRPARGGKLKAYKRHLAG